jgi:hypothetical protein
LIFLLAWQRFELVVEPFTASSMDSQKNQVELADEDLFTKKSQQLELFSQTNSSFSAQSVGMPPSAWEPYWPMKPFLGLDDVSHSLKRFFARLGLPEEEL